MKRKKSYKHLARALNLNTAEPKRHIKKLFATTDGDDRQMKLRSNTYDCELKIHNGVYYAHAQNAYNQQEECSLDSNKMTQLKIH